VAISNGVAIGDGMITGGKMVTGGKMANSDRIVNNKIVISANLFKIIIDVNSITILTTCGIIVDMKTTSRYKYLKEAICQLTVVHELIR
jgi:hypothetical protein